MGLISGQWNGFNLNFWDERADGCDQWHSVQLEACHSWGTSAALQFNIQGGPKSCTWVGIVPGWGPTIWWAAEKDLENSKLNMSQQCMRQSCQQVEGGNPCLSPVLWDMWQCCVQDQAPQNKRWRHMGGGLVEDCWDDEALGISGIRWEAGGAGAVQTGEEESQEGLVCRNWYLWLISVVPTYGSGIMVLSEGTVWLLLIICPGYFRAIYYYCVLIFDALSYS